jgi:RimJ/RimL family protein N-acetyltransferase
MTNTFRTSRLIYRAIEKNEEDTAFLHTLRLDYDAFANLTANHLFKPQSKSSTEYFATFLRDVALLGVLVCLPSTSPADASDKPAVEYSSTKPIGYIFLSERVPQLTHHRNTEIAVQIIAEEQGKGYGTEAINWALDWSFKIAGLHRVGIECFSFNDGARRLYERMGFVLEGRKREAVFFDGAWHDIIELSMLEGEWRERAKQLKG